MTKIVEGRFDTLAPWSLLGDKNGRGACHLAIIAAPGNRSLRNGNFAHLQTSIRLRIAHHGTNLHATVASRLIGKPTRSYKFVSICKKCGNS